MLHIYNFTRHTFHTAERLFFALKYRVVRFNLRFLRNASRPIRSHPQRIFNWIFDRGSKRNILLDTVEYSKNAAVYNLPADPADIFSPLIVAYKFKGSKVSAYSSTILMSNSVSAPDYYIENRRATISDGIFNIQTYPDGKSEIRDITVSRKSKGIFLGGSGSANWYHWLVDILPGVLFSRNLPIEYRDWPFLIPERLTRSNNNFIGGLRIIDKERKLIPLYRGTYKIDELLVFNNILQEPMNLQRGLIPIESDYRINRELLLFYRRELLSAAGLDFSKSGKKRIFLARSSKFRSYNQDEVISVVRRYGFSVVYPEQLDFKEQIHLFAEAEFVIGPSGAAFANLIFCRRPCCILIWIPDVYNEFMSFRNISESLGLDFNVMYYEIKGEYISTGAVAKSKYSLDIELLEQKIIDLIRKGWG